MIDPIDIERFVDDRLEKMARCPLMWGDPLAIETQCFLLVEVYGRYCLNDDDVADAGSPDSRFQAFRRGRLRRCPGPVLLSQWFTDPKWGDPLGDDENAVRHNAGRRIVEFFIAFKAHLKEQA